MLIVAALAVAALGLGAPFLVPFTEALLVWFVVNALADALRRLPGVGAHLPGAAARWVAAAVVLLVGLVVVYSTARSLVHLGPQAFRLQTSLDPLVRGIAALFGTEGAAVIDRALDAIGLESLMRQVVLGLIGLVNHFGLVAIYVAFLLVDQAFFPAKLRILFPHPGRRNVAAAFVADLASQIRAYLWIMTKASAATAVLSLVAMSLAGLESPVFWAFLVFLLNFIPTIGSILGTLLPAAFALVQTGDLGLAAVLLAVLGTVQFTIGNVVLPRLAGETLNLSLSVTVLCLFVWGALWGVTGMFLAVPLTAILVLTAARFDATLAVAVVLSRTGILAGNPAPPLGPAPPAHLHQDTGKLQ
ncbi:MAG: AI-2E family transporter [Paracoccaceae bacterium]|nr:AI-2E family transporter [Paracoccaceae bacterium]